MYLVPIVFIFLVSLVLVGCARSPSLVTVPSRLPGAVVVRDVAVLDVVSGARVPHRDVFVESESIARIVPHDDAAAPADAVVIEGHGGTLLPGLIDLHAHTGTSPAPHSAGEFPDPGANLRAYLYCGVTTVVDLGDLPSRVFDRRDAVAAREIPGPTLYAVGPTLTAPGGHPVPILRLVLPFWMRWYAIPRYTKELATPEEGTAAAAALANEGADFLKVVVDRIPPEAPRIDQRVLTAAVASARGHGLRTVAHIGTTDDAVDAGTAGAAAWAHVVYRERILDDRIAELAAFGIPMIPTLVAFEAMASQGEGPREASRLERETVPVEILDAFDAPAPHPFFDESARFLRTQRSHWYDNVARLHAAGVEILAGSDMQSGVFPGAGLHRELHHLASAGLGNLDVIRAATVGAARFLTDSESPDFGIVAVGKRADLLLVDGDPVADLGALERIRAVIVRGVPVERTPVR